jgi:ADP-ribose pyrophosphatase YjhB (NUDIX family)
MKRSAGLVIIYDNKILLVHPTKHPWIHSFSIPKGMIEENETVLDAAIRETFEEVGLFIDKNQIKDNEEYLICYRDKHNKIYKKIYYYIVNLEYNDFDVIPFQNLQVEEVDWAGFLSKEEAIKRISPKLISVLDHLK